MLRGAMNDCAALHFAGSALAQRHPWTTHSYSRMAIVQADVHDEPAGEGEPGMTPEFANRDPNNDAGLATWTWKDGSAASLKFDHGESIRMRKHERVA